MSRTLPTISIIAFSLPVAAQNAVEAIYGLGPDNYDSYVLKASVDIGKLPLNFDVRNFVARTDKTEIVNEVEWGVTWLPTDWLTADFHRQTAQAPALDVEANRFGLSMNMAALWNSKLDTMLDLGYARITYDPSAGPNAKAALDSLLPESNNYTIGLMQDLTENLSFSASFDDYHYSKDPVALATLLMRRSRRPNTGIFQIIAFPDRGNSLELTWKPVSELKIQLSNNRTYTVIDQKLNSIRLDMSYRIGKDFTLGAAATRAKSEEIKRRSTIIQEETAGNYFEINAKLRF